MTHCINDLVLLVALWKCAAEGHDNHPVNGYNAAAKRLAARGLVSINPTCAYQWRITEEGREFCADVVASLGAPVQQPNCAQGPRVVRDNY